MPREWRGNTFAGEAYVLLFVSCGESGARLKDAKESPEGICKERPRCRKSGRRGVFGSLRDVLMVWSSLDSRSFIFGDGDSFGVESDSDLPLEGLLEGVRVGPSLLKFGVESPPFAPIAASFRAVSNSRSCCVNSEKDFDSMLAITDRPSPGPGPDPDSNAVVAVVRCMVISIMMGVYKGVMASRGADWTCLQRSEVY